MLQEETTDKTAVTDVPFREVPVSPFRIQGIPWQAVEHFWPFAEPYIKRALDHTMGEFTPYDIKQLCMERSIQLWLVMKETRIIAAATTEIVVYPRRKHCRIVTLAGTNGDEWTGLLDQTLIAWAKQLGCNGMEAFVRKGYVQKLAQYGFRHKYSSVVKEI